METLIPHALRIRVLWVSRSILDLDLVLLFRIICSLCDISSFMAIAKITLNLLKGTVFIDFKIKSSHSFVMIELQWGYCFAYNWETRQLAFL